MIHALFRSLGNYDYDQTLSNTQEDDESGAAFVFDNSLTLSLSELSPSVSQHIALPRLHSPEEDPDGLLLLNDNDHDASDLELKAQAIVDNYSYVSLTDFEEGLYDLVSTTQSSEGIALSEKIRSFLDILSSTRNRLKHDSIPYLFHLRCVKKMNVISHSHAQLFESLFGSYIEQGQASPLAVELRQFFQTHLYDTDNCLIGQLVAVNTDILRASETRSKRNAEIALASLSLITEVSSWQQDDDATILTKARQLSQLCADAWRPGDLLVAELPDEVRPQLVYGRFSGVRRKGKIGVFLDPLEARPLFFSPNQLHAFSSTMLSRLREASSTLSLVHDHMIDFQRKIEKTTSLLWYRFLEQHRYIHDIDHITTALRPVHYFAVEHNLSLLKNLQSQDHSALKPFAELVSTSTRATASQMLDDLGPDAVHLFAPRRLACVRDIGWAPSAILSAVEQGLSQCISLYEEKLARLQAVFNTFKTGQAASQLESWWQTVVTKRVSNFLLQHNFDFSLLNDSPLAKELSNMATLRTNLNVLRLAADETRDPFNVRRLHAEIAAEVYPRVDSFVEDSLAVLAAEFRMQRNVFLSYLDEPAALLARLQWLLFCDEIELESSDKSIEWAHHLTAKLRQLVRTRQAHLLGVGGVTTGGSLGSSYRPPQTMYTSTSHGDVFRSRASVDIGSASAAAAAAAKLVNQQRKAELSQSGRMPIPFRNASSNSGTTTTPPSTAPTTTNASIDTTPRVVSPREPRAASRTPATSVALSDRLPYNASSRSLSGLNGFLANENSHPNSPSDSKSHASSQSSGRNGGSTQSPSSDDSDDDDDDDDGQDNGGSPVLSRHSNDTPLIDPERSTSLSHRSNSSELRVSLSSSAPNAARVPNRSPLHDTSGLHDSSPLDRRAATPPPRLQRASSSLRMCLVAQEDDDDDDNVRQNDSKKLDNSNNNDKHKSNGKEVSKNGTKSLTASGGDSNLASGVRRLSSLEGVPLFGETKKYKSIEGAALICSTSDSKSTPRGSSASEASVTSTIPVAMMPRRQSDSHTEHLSEAKPALPSLEKRYSQDDILLAMTAESAVELVSVSSGDSRRRSSNSGTPPPLLAATQLNGSSSRLDMMVNGTKPTSSESTEDETFSVARMVREELSRLQLQMQAVTSNNNDQ
eukprot:CAMPEP_0168603360 /NCGR_PEP_ID=MMETSP0420-20121227/14686_1 /TAXON_ID=498008 /ORGANISM="Pessonella sp." /LENGTH=1150 /DNA_ID=CAMNT_0008642333 /DNA_START=26 /DNA_END=3475 /DNA_ORIENTATION=+